MADIRLPRERTTFVGRENELAELELRMNGGEQLIVVVGPGGTGKTRLVVHFARRLYAGAHTRSGELWFVDLAAARTREDLCRAVARAFDARVGAAALPEDLARVVGGAIAAQRELLLVLDNFEQLEARAAEVIRTWCDAAPHAVLLVTSRRRLGLQDESVLEIGSLPVPDSADDLDALEKSPAVRLFIDRAERVRPGFHASRTELQQIGRLVGALEGLPLAIELCAAKMHVLGTADLIEQLGRRFELLVDATPHRPDRQGSLRSTIDWSFDLLDPTERDALAQCSVFRGSFAIEAAEHVLEIKSPGEGRTVLSVLARLIEQSLVFSVDAPGVAGERRFALLESVREYAAGRLTVSQAERARARHADWYGSRAIEWSRDRDAPEARRRMLADANDLITAVEELQRRARSSASWDASAVEAMASLEPLFLSQGPIDRFVARLDAVLESAPPSAAAAALARARARRARGWCRAVVGRTRDALEDLEQALLELDQYGDPDDRVAVRSRLAMAALLEGDPDLAGRHFAAGIALFGPEVLVSTRVELLWRYSNYLRQTGELERALAASEESLAHLAAARDRGDEAIVLLSVADCHLELGRIGEALGYYDRTLLCARQIGDRRVEAQAATHRACAALEAGQTTEAIRGLEAALAVHRNVGNRVFEGLTHAYLGLALFEAGDYNRACENYTTALGLLSIRHEQGLVHGARAIAHARRGRRMAALGDLAAAERCLAAFPAERAYLEVVQCYLDASDTIERGESLEGVKQRVRDFESTELPVCFAIRFALRALKRLFDPRAAEAAELAIAPPAPPRLRVAEDGRWFQVQSEQPVEFRRQAALRNLLLRLALERDRAPGVSLSLEALREAGWPGERMLSESAQNRVYVALSRLRQRGLRGLLVSRDDGWLLDPRVIVEWAPPVSRPG